MQAALARPGGNPRQPCASAAVENNAAAQTNPTTSGFIVSPFLQPEQTKPTGARERPTRIGGQPIGVGVARVLLICQRQHSLHNRAEANEHHEQLEQIC